MTTALRVKNLCTAYREAMVINHVSFALPAGEVLGIVGPNGAGKSTLIKAAMGLIPALAGEVEFLGQPLSKVRSRVGYMPQQSDVDWDFPATVKDVVLMGTYGKLGWLRRPGKAEYQAVSEAMEAVGITDLANRQIGQLSGGQKQRTFLARTLAGKPDLVLMDEPFAGVDAASEAAIVQVLRDLQAKGTTLAVVHHDLATVSRFCSWVLLINKEVISFGPREQAFNSQVVARAYGLGDLEAQVANVWTR